MRSRALRPWTGNDLVIVCVTTIVALGLVAVGWHGVSGEVEVRRQVLWLDLGVAGVLLLGVGNAQWVLRGRRAVGDRRARLLPLGGEPIGEPAGGLTPGAGTAGAPPMAPRRAEGVVAGAAMTRYHRPDCELVAGKEVVTAGRNEHAAQGRRPCAVCEP
jgi:hypothetical protein